MADFSAVIGPLSAALGLSVVVERVLEFFKNVVEPRIGVQGAREVPDLSQTDKKIDDLSYMYELSSASRAIDSDPKELPKKLEGLENQLKTEADPGKRKILTDKIADLKSWGEWDERFPQSRVLVMPATDPDDGTTMRAFVLQLLGFAAGIILARAAGVGLFKAFLGYNVDVMWWDYVLTGLLIGGGSAPVHVLIRFITERKVPAEAQEPVSEEKKAAAVMEEAPSAPAVITPPADAAAEEWVDIPYYGGVDRSLLEDIHKRAKNPDMVVYHHTAMSSRSTFEDVVHVIKNRTDSRGNKWLTGYNCVILADGSVHAFCRWDRYGSHAVGYNQRSLGISFNGNFETNPKVPFSNPNGKYGPSRPTEEQLKAGARVVALWTLLYRRIAPDFEKSIIPHKKISDKTCPGNMFPYDDFKKWVEFYRTRWAKSSLVKERIEAFKQKPYLFVKEA